jgi:hypothetical protein
MDPLQTRLEALEQQMHTVENRLRWWRGLACGLAVVGLLGWGLPLGLAREDSHEKDKDQKGLAQRVAALESLLKHFSREKNDIFITGANLHIVNGLGSTNCGSEEEPIPDCPNGLGNLIMGYNEPRGGGLEDIRTGSHNVVVGQQHNFSSFGGLVVSHFNTISGPLAVAIGGVGNTASGLSAVVIGGASNLASGLQAVVNSGEVNVASGGLSAVSGGVGNTASGDRSTVSGGQTIAQDTEFGWSAGSEADEAVEGNFRSP